jgi:hypothetical protein|tara:strand:- start:274 stop:792 length:519 start_codon:yes stop_codon:yes gene_type:complete
MAVPTNGVLSMQSMAQEALYGTYGSGSVTGPISLYDMVNGGNTNGSGNSYPTINQNCLPNPASRGAYVPFLILKKYTNSSLVSTNTYYLDPSEAANPENLTNGDILYTDANLTTPVGAHSGTGNVYVQDQPGPSKEQSACGLDGIWPNSGAWEVTTDANGAITIVNCSCTGC